MESKDTTRNGYLDFVRGVAIILVLWGHCIQYGTVDGSEFFYNPMFKLIYSFHMPLFMLISGYLLYYSIQKYSAGKTILSRIKSLGWPLLIWGCMPTFISEASQYMHGVEMSLYSVIKSGYYIVLGVTSIWFVWAVLVCSVVFSIVIGGGYKHSVLKKIVLLILSVLVIAVLPGNRNNLFMYPFLIVGYYWHNIDNKQTIKQRLQIISIIVFVFLLAFYNYDSYIYNSGLYITNHDWMDLNQIGTDIYRYVVGFSGSVTILTGLRWIYNRCQKAFGYIERIGTISLQIYILQRFVVEMYGYKKMCEILVQYANYNPLTQNHIAFDFIITPVLAVMFTVLIERIVYLMQKTKLSSILFGR